jgi:muramoyltetrapeptide carboxypeptidase
MIKTPENLKIGDLIGIIPPAKSIEPVYVAQAIEVVEKWGLRVKLSGNIESKYHQFAGKDEIRERSLQDFMDSEEINCILCARGGYGTTRILDGLNFDKFLKRPKWMVGYSDITALLVHLYQLGFEGIHGPMPVNFSEPDAGESLERLRRLLMEGEIDPIHIERNCYNIQGKVHGRLIGGNLSMLVNLLGTRDEFSTEGKILFIEEVDEYLYRIDRMLVQLKRSGKLKNLAGLIVGHFTRVKDNEEPFGTGVEEIFLNLVAEYHYPVCFGAPFGHIMPNFPIVLGRNFHLEVSQEMTILRPSKD